MQTHYISFKDAKEQVATAVKELKPDESLVKWVDSVGNLLMKNLEGPVDLAMFHLISGQSLSQVHKKEMYDSFKYEITPDGIELTFKPVTPLMDALENGAPERSLADSVLSRNYKVSKDNHRYKVIPLKSKETVKGALNFVPKSIVADVVAEEMFFREIQALIGNKEKTLQFEARGGTDREAYWRSEAFVARVKKGSKTEFRSERVYVAMPRGKTVDNMSRFVTFRTITDNPAKQWRPIPGFPGLKLAEQLVTLYTDLIKEETNRLIERLP